MKHVVHPRLGSTCTQNTLPCLYVHCCNKLPLLEVKMDSSFCLGLLNTHCFWCIHLRRENDLWGERTINEGDECEWTWIGKSVEYEERKCLEVAYGREFAFGNHKLLVVAQTQGIWAAKTKLVHRKGTKRRQRHISFFHTTKHLFWLVTLEDHNPRGTIDTYCRSFSKKTWMTFFFFKVTSITILAFMKVWPHGTPVCLEVTRRSLLLNWI